MRDLGKLILEAVDVDLDSNDSIGFTKPIEYSTLMKSGVIS